MAGKFLNLWSLRSGAKAVSVFIIVVLAVAIYATREIPDSFEGNKEWKFWRNLDFAVSIVSLAFASVLLYGSITEFRMFLLAWMIWNAILTTFWISFLVRKRDELARWERVYRLFAVIFMVLAEIPIIEYFRYLKAKSTAQESNASWAQEYNDKQYKTLCEQRSISSLNSVFGRSVSVENKGFQGVSARNSFASEAHEETEEMEESSESSETKSQASSVISVTVQIERDAETDVAEMPSEQEETKPDEGKDGNGTVAVEIPATTEANQGVGTSASASEPGNRPDETQLKVADNQVPTAMVDISDTAEEAKSVASHTSTVNIEIDVKEGESTNDCLSSS